MSDSRFRSRLVFLLVLALVAATSGAQEKPVPNPPGLTVLPFDFSPPGARALAMGNTFVALADDATASESNPAGLMILSKPEVSMHLRSASEEPRVLDLNAVEAQRIVAGPPIFDLGGAEIDGEELQRFDDDGSAVSFASVVWPSERWSVAAYADRTIDFAGRGEFTLWEPSFRDLYRTEQSIRLSQESVGLTGAVLVGPVAIGLSVRSSRLEVDATAAFRLDFYRDFEILTDLGDRPEELLDSELLDFYRLTDRVAGSDRDLTWNAGVLLNPRGRWTVGAVYKKGGEYEIPETVEELICLDFRLFSSCDPSDPVNLDPSRFNSYSVDGSVRTIRLPDLLGLGVAWRPNARVAVGLDLNLVTYSDLADGAATPEDLDPFVAARLEEVEDEVEINAGFEYFFFISSVRRFETAVRGGFYTESDHDGVAGVDSSEDHFTLGLGLNAGSLQVDLTAHRSDRTEELLLSTIYKFGRR